MRTLLVLPGEDLRLSRRPTRVRPIYDGKAAYKSLLAERTKAIAKLQQALYAGRGAALLVILQALDAAGKDGAIRHVFSGVNPQGCQVHNFKSPSEDELRHDFLWRTTAALPERGLIGIFNRSYYEETLVVRVHPELLASEGASAKEQESFWDRRFESIRDHERHLTRNAVMVLKIFLHISREEQRQRLLRRIRRPDRHWKLSAADMAERTRSNDYTDAYQACLGATSTEYAPWWVVPADDKKNARLLIAELVLQSLKTLNPQYPATPEAVLRNLDVYRRKLEAEASESG